MSTSCYCFRFKKRSYLWLSCNNYIRYNFYRATSFWIHKCTFYDFWWNIRVNFLYDDRFPWISCTCRHNFFKCLFNSFTLKSFYLNTPYWFWSCSLILTFCRCCMIVIIHNYLLMRKLVQKINSNCAVGRNR